jgi:hypothetical protein
MLFAVGLVLLLQISTLSAQQNPQQQRQKAAEKQDDNPLPLDSLPPLREGLFYQGIITRAGMFYPWGTFLAGEDAQGEAKGGPRMAVYDQEKGFLELCLFSGSELQMPAHIAVDSGAFFAQPEGIKLILIATDSAVLRDWPDTRINWSKSIRYLAKNSRSGNGLALAPEGTMVLHCSEITTSTYTGVELPSGVAGQRFATVRNKAFLSPMRNSFWNRSNQVPIDRAANLAEPFDFKVLHPTPEVLLTSFFIPGRPLLSNAKGAMRRIFVDANPKNRNFALVETDGPWLAGSIEMAPKIADETGTWSVIESVTERPFRLRRLKNRQPAPRTPLFSLLERRDREFSPVRNVSPERLRITKPLLAAAQEAGLERVFRLMLAPTTAACSFDPEEIAAALKDVRDVESIEVFAEADRAVPGAFQVTVVERGYLIGVEPKVVTTATGSTTTAPSSKQFKEETVRSLSADEDGKLRLTDGQKIYVLSQEKNRISVEELLMEPNPQHPDNTENKSNSTRRPAR